MEHGTNPRNANRPAAATHPRNASSQRNRGLSDQSRKGRKRTESIRTLEGNLPTY